MCYLPRVNTEIRKPNLYDVQPDFELIFTSSSPDTIEMLTDYLTRESINLCQQTSANSNSFIQKKNYVTLLSVSQGWGHKEYCNKMLRKPI